MTIRFHVKAFSLIAALLVAAALTPVVPSTPPAPPAAPILLSPAAGAVMDNGCKGTPNGITWDFDWSDVPSVAPTTQYQLRVWKNPALPVINKTILMTSEYHHTSAPSDYIINTNLTGWRFGYIEMADGLALNQAVRLGDYHYDGTDGVRHVTIALQKRFELSTGRLIDEDPFA